MKQDKVSIIPATKPLLSAIDKITIAYCGWVVVYMLFGILMGRAVSPEIHLPKFVTIIAAVLLLAWLERYQSTALHPILLKILHFVRSIYPVSLFGYLYISLYSVNRIMFTQWLDPLFMGIDFKIFGYYPSMVWAQKYGNWLMQEFFHLAYFCYYPMIGGLPLYLYIKNKAAFRELIFNLTFVFYACYFFYSIVPVIGGRFFPEAMYNTELYRFGPFTQIMAYIYIHSAHWGGAFPSSHVAITVVLTIAALRYTRKMGYVFSVIAFFLSLATVYCQYHWFIDAVAGVLTGIIGYYAANNVRRKLQSEI